MRHLRWWIGIVLLSPLLVVWAQDGVVDTTVTSSARMRTGPGTDWRIVTTLEVGTAMRLDGQAYDGTWARGIAQSGERGWVVASALALPANQVAALPTRWIDDPFAIEAPPAAPVVVARPTDPAPAIAGVPTTVNGVPIGEFLPISAQVRANIQTIAARGNARGRNPRTFSKIGDSTIEGEFFMGRFDINGGYDLGDYAYLQPTINRYRGSFSRQGYAVQRGLRAFSVMSSDLTNRQVCNAGEIMLACEFRVQNPSVVFIRVGSNDTRDGEGFAQALRDIVSFSIAQGVVPIVGTKADRFEGSNRNNTIIRAVAAEYSVPLWDFDRIAETLPNRGLGPDGVHLTYYAHNFRLPEAFQNGYPVHNLTALIALELVVR